MVFNEDHIDHIFDKNSGLNSNHDQQAYIKKYYCDSCKMDFCAANHDEINYCVVCGEKIIRPSVFLEEEESSEMLIISFSQSLQDAVRKYKEEVFYKPLVPFAFKKKNVIKRS